jgi:hypothetical protein
MGYAPFSTRDVRLRADIRQRKLIERRFPAAYSTCHKESALASIQAKYI